MTKRSAERTDFLAGIIVSAIEGGINYWAEHKDYEWEDVSEAPGAPLAYARAWVREANEDGDEPGKWLRLNEDTVARGLGLIRKRDDIPFLGTGTRKAIIGADYTLDEEGEIDADLADIIVQVALLGEVRYA